MSDHSFYELKANKIGGEEISMQDYAGKTVLVVNTASKCGFTPQYEGLQKLYEDYKEKGLVILGFPCDQFAHQEPGTDEEIAQFCQMNYGVDFPMFSKIEVNGKGTHPIFKLLKDETKSKLGKAIKWNFTKFLVDKEGNPVKRFEPTVTPENLVPEIEELL